MVFFFPIIMFSTKTGDVETGKTDALSGFTAQEKTELNQVHWILRIMYMVVAMLLAACASYAITLSQFSINISGKISTEAWAVIFIAGYVYAFAVIICCFEIGLSIINKCMADNFGFLYSVLGRTIFLAMVAGLCAKLYLFGFFMIAFLVLSLIIHYVLLFRNPRLGEYVQTLHYYADK